MPFFEKHIWRLVHAMSMRLSYEKAKFFRSWVIYAIKDFVLQFIRAAEKKGRSNLATRLCTRPCGGLYSSMTAWWLISAGAKQTLVSSSLRNSKSKQLSLCEILKEKKMLLETKLHLLHSLTAVFIVMLSVTPDPRVRVVIIRSITT